MSHEPLCVCHEPTCQGSPTGTTCLFSPGLTFGTGATEPLAALIEAVGELLANLTEADLVTNDHKQELEYGELYPDIRRLYATLAFARQRETCYTVKYPDGRITVQGSLEAFERAACSALASHLAVIADQANDEQALDADTGAFTNEICQVVDLVVPEPEDATSLLVFAVWNPAFFAAASEYYDVENGLEPAHIVYENAYQHTRRCLEEHWDGIIDQARQLAQQWSIQQDERQALDLLRDRLRQNMAFPSDDYGVLTRLITAEQKRLEGMTCLRGSGQ